MVVVLIVLVLVIAVIVVSKIVIRVPVATKVTEQQKITRDEVAIMEVGAFVVEVGFPRTRVNQENRQLTKGSRKPTEIISLAVTCDKWNRKPCTDQW